MKKEIVIAEIKLNKSLIDFNLLKKKATKLLASYPDYKPQFLGLSIDDVKDYM